jgi:hypothetical protein
MDHRPNIIVPCAVATYTRNLSFHLQVWWANVKEKKKPLHDVPKMVEHCLNVGHLHFWGIDSKFNPNL